MNGRRGKRNRAGESENLFFLLCPSLSRAVRGGRRRGGKRLATAAAYVAIRTWVKEEEKKGAFLLVLPPLPRIHGEDIRREGGGKKLLADG